MTALFRRRQVWLPTLWGWLVILAVGGAAAVFVAWNINGFLAPNEPAVGKDGTGARTLVVEGWMNETDLLQAVAVVRRGRYDRVLTTGGPIESWRDFRAWKTFADMSADYLKGHGLADAPIISVPAPASAQDRTFLNGVVVREWAKQNGVTLDAIDLFSAGVHARRSRLNYRLALGPDVEVGVIASIPDPKEYDGDHWWRTSAGAKGVIGETLSLIWTKFCFWPPPPGSHEERWAVPRSAK